MIAWLSVSMVCFWVGWLAMVGWMIMSALDRRRANRGRILRQCAHCGLRVFLRSPPFRGEGSDEFLKRVVDVAFFQFHALCEDRLVPAIQVELDACIVDRDDKDVVLITRSNGEIMDFRIEMLPPTPREEWA